MGKGQAELPPDSNVTPASALVVAVENYDRHPKLEGAAAAAAALACALAEGGIANVFPNCLRGGKSKELATPILAWMQDAGHDDRLFLYWTGHGMREADGFYLITQESPANNFNQTNAVEPRSLAKGAANSKARKILIVLDACFSGDALGDVMGTISAVLSGQAPTAWSRRGIAVLASAHALEQAREGMLSDILKGLLSDSRADRRWSDEDQFIDWERLLDSVEDERRRRGIEQTVVPTTIGWTSELLPNPRYRPGLVGEIVEERTWRLSDWQGVEHFDLAARGIEVGESGWYFAGRRRLLRTLVGWLQDAPQGIRIVTGPPGSGKSAVIGRLATLSDPEYRKAAIRAHVMLSASDETVPPEGIIDVAIHAKGKTLDDCARALVRAFRLPIGGEAAVDVDAVVAAVGTIRRRLTVIIDALDEAASAHGHLIARCLVVPLGRLTRVRVLVGSRRSVDGAVLPEGEERHSLLRAVFGADALIDELEDEPDTAEDIAEYVRLRLAASPWHCNNPVGIAAAAERVAARAAGVFLYARIVSRTLRDDDRLDRELPSTALAAFAHDLRTRFEAHEQKVDDLLAALAWGEGKGLTRRVWPLIANALAQRSRSYDDDDVAWVLGHAGWHIIEAGEDGQAVYRLGHQALADHYRGRWEVRAAQTGIVEALTAAVAGASWLECDRYVWRYLADHARQAGGLAELIRDPGYLAVADPARLVTALPGLADDGSGRRLADVYNRVVDRLIGPPPVERLPLIHLMAQIEAPDLASLLEPPVPARWRCRWARVQPSTPHRVIGRHEEPVNCVALGVIDGHAVVASGSADNTIRLWDVRSGSPIGPPLVGHMGEVTAVALSVTDGRAVVVSASKDGTIRLWDARSGSPIGGPLAGSTDPVRVAVGTAQGRIIMVSEGDDNKTIRLWDARSGQTIGEPLTGHAGEVTAVALGAVDGHTVVVSGGADNTIRFWDVRSGAPIGQMPAGHVDWVTAVVIGEVAGRAVVASGSHDGTIRLWDARSGSPIGRILAGHADAVSAVALGMADGRPVVASGSYDKTIRLWHARSEPASDRMLAGHAGWVTAVAMGVVDGHGVVASGSRDGNVWLWDARSGSPIRKLGGHTDGVSAVALGVVDGRAVVASGSYDTTVRLWDAHSGTPIGRALTGHTGEVNAVALGAVDGRAVVVSGSDDKTLRLWDAQTGMPIGRPLTVRHMDWVTAVTLGAVDGRAVVVSGGKDKIIRLWDVRSGRPAGNLKGHREWVSAVALGMADGRAVVVSGSRDGAIRLWDARRGRPIGQPLTGHTGLVTAVAMTAVDGREVVVSGSDDHTIRLWDARTRLSEAVVDLGAPVLSIACQSHGEIAVGMPTGLLLLEFQRDAEITKDKANGATADDA